MAFFHFLENGYEIMTSWQNGNDGNVYISIITITLTSNLNINLNEQTAHIY